MEHAVVAARSGAAAARVGPGASGYMTSRVPACPPYSRKTEKVDISILFVY